MEMSARKPIVRRTSVRWKLCGRPLLEVGDGEGVAFERRCGRLNTRCSALSGAHYLPIYRATHIFATIEFESSVYGWLSAL